MKTKKILKVFAFILLLISVFFITFFLVLNKDFKINFNFKQNFVDFELTKKIYYVAVDHQFELEINNPENIAYLIKFENEEIVNLVDNHIKTISNGTTNFDILVGDTKIDGGTINVVKGIENMPKTFNKNKAKIACNDFTKEENDMLDLTLKDRINEAGYKTRAGAVAAARFLTLEFAKRIPYFYENGRLNNYGKQKYVDGEGRYYHEGLYLHSSRYEQIVSSFTGPAAWGCKLKQYQDAKVYGFVPGVKYPNGLDCSGFVTWALLNGGFDVKDSGAGDIISIKDDLYDLGTKETLNKTIINSGKIKVGDLIAYPGHMSILIGIDEENNYYIAESLPQYKGVVANKYSSKELLGVFTDVILMDSVYENDGNLTNLWY